ncbi:MAG TPA: hypothetical protein VMS84_07795 [Mycobacterium sp.]|nr:hypothetical protein [Mycobacterium sp.]
MSPKCTECPHLAKQHNLDGDGKCRVRILSGWNFETGQYTSWRPCGCPGYHGEDPDNMCACEYVSASPNCVHCGKVKV